MRLFINSLRQRKINYPHTAFLFLLLLWNVFVGCYSPRDTNIQPVDTIGFQIINHNGDVLPVKCYGVISTQSIHIHDLDKLPFENLDNIELTTYEGNRTTPIERMSNETQLIFKPVHSRRIYQETGLRGDIDFSYKLSRKNSDVLNLVCDTALLSRSKDSFSIEKRIQVYRLNQPVILERLAQQNASRHISETEMFFDGCWVKINAYHIDDTLKINGRLVNQTGNTIEIDPSHFVMMIDDSLVHTHRASPMFVAPNGGRAEFGLQFILAKSVKSFDINYVSSEVSDTLPGIFSIGLALTRNELSGR